MDISTAFAGIGIVDLTAMVVLYIVFAPRPWTPRREWIWRSIFAGSILGIGGACLVLCIVLGTSSKPAVVFSPVLLIALGVGLAAALFGMVATYLRVLLWDMRIRSMKQVVNKLRKR